MPLSIGLNESSDSEEGKIFPSDSEDSKDPNQSFNEGAQIDDNIIDSSQQPTSKAGDSLAELVKSPLSTLQTVQSQKTGTIVTLGEKGRLIRQQTRKRKGVGDKDYFSIMKDKFFEGNELRARAAVDKFHIANANESTKYEATGMLKMLYDMGAKRALLTSVFNIGGYRYDGLKKAAQPRREYFNVNAVTQEQIEQLSVTRKLLPVADEGYACNHRQQVMYIGDEEITSIAKLYAKYYRDESSISGKKMAQETFRKYWNAYHSDIKFKKLREDECDTCIQLTIGKQRMINLPFIISAIFISAFN